MVTGARASEALRLRAGDLRMIAPGGCDELLLEIVIRPSVSPWCVDIIAPDRELRIGISCSGPDASLLWSAP